MRRPAQRALLKIGLISTLLALVPSMRLTIPATSMHGPTHHLVLGAYINQWDPTNFDCAPLLETQPTQLPPSIWPTVPISYTFVTSDVVNLHMSWHMTYPPDTVQPGWGSKFRHFHRNLLNCFFAWRRKWNIEAQYGPIQPWLPGVNARAPMSFLNHNGFNRPAGFLLPTPARPSYYTVEGGTAPDPYYTNTVKLKLADYTTEDELGISLWTTWHANVHTQAGVLQFRNGAGGDFGTFEYPPWDPLFWHWHYYVEIVFAEWDALNVNLPLVQRSP